MPAEQERALTSEGLAMIITCENCETSFNLNEKLLKPTGSKVRCSRCKHMFTAYPPAPPEVEQALAETGVPEGIEETAQGVDGVASETTQTETDGMAAEALEAPESPVTEAGETSVEEAAGDSFPEAIEGAAEDEARFGEETESVGQETMEPSLDDLDLEFDIDTVSGRK